MGFNDILKSLFGNKSDRDMKELMPIVAKVNAEWEKLKSISADELRAVAEDMKKEVREYIGEEENEIAALKRKVEEERPSIEEREEIYDRIDKLEEQIDKKVEEVLTGLMPKAFAVMKETARRFKENTEIEVTATQFDRDLAVTHDFVEIEGDKAIYFNSWLAGGNEVTWDMVHYDVQLIGGAVLHQGKIAEMATGEGKTLVATLPVFLNALSGRGVHMVTVNDYLPNVTRSGWGRFICSMGFLSIVSISINPILPSVGRLIWPILLSVRTTNSVSIICVIIWLSIRRIWYSVSTILRLSTRSIPY